MGDPFKDTSGPSMNILIKLMSIVSLVIAPSLATMFETGGHAKTPTKAEMTFRVNTDDLSTNEIVARLRDLNLIAEKGNTSIEMKDGKLMINGKAVDKDILMKLNLDDDVNFSLDIRND